MKSAYYSSLIENWIHTFITLQLDYCNALLSGCSNSLNSLSSLQLKQNAAARTLTITTKYLTCTWLPVKSRIDFKVLFLIYKALKRLGSKLPQIMNCPLLPTKTTSFQSAGLLVIPRISKSTIGGRAFWYRAPLLCNNIPASIWEANTLSIFKSRLKTFLFSASHSLAWIPDRT